MNTLQGDTLFYLYQAPYFGWFLTGSGYDLVKLFFLALGFSHFKPLQLWSQIPGQPRERVQRSLFVCRVLGEIGGRIRIPWHVGAQADGGLKVMYSGDLCTPV